MVNFFKKIFAGKETTLEDNKKKTEQKNFEIFKYDGLRAVRMGRLDYAKKCFVEALALQDDFETMHYLSDLHVRLGELDDAKQLLLSMIEAEPSYIDSYLELANIYYLEENYAEMTNVAQKALTIDENNAAIHFLLGKASAKVQDLIMTVAHLTKAVLLKSNFIEARLLRAETLLKMGQTKEADEDIEFILSQNPEDESAILLRGKLNELVGQVDDAEELYHNVLALNPFSEQAYLALGGLLLRKEKVNEVIDLYTEAIEMNANIPSFYQERGRAKLMSGDKEGSITDMKKALELNPTDGNKLDGEYNSLKPQESVLPGIL